MTAMVYEMVCLRIMPWWRWCANRGVCAWYRAYGDGVLRWGVGYSIYEPTENANGRPIRNVYVGDVDPGLPAPIPAPSKRIQLYNEASPTTTTMNRQTNMTHPLYRPLFASERDQPFASRVMRFPSINNTAA